WAILEHRPRAVVAAGSCGGLAADVEVGTLIVGDSFTWSLADATAFGYAPGQVPGGPERHRADPSWVERAERAARNADTAGAGHGVRRGLMLSGDAFVTASIAGPVRERFPGALSADMETTACARTAGAAGTRSVALRAASDRGGPAAGQQFRLEIDLVAEISARAVAELAGGLCPRRSSVQKPHHRSAGRDVGDPGAVRQRPHVLADAL